jgi:hypothetical protein
MPLARANTGLGGCHPGLALAGSAFTLILLIRARLSIKPAFRRSEPSIVGSFGFCAQFKWIRDMARAVEQAGPGA